jgi:hypothetical protein
MLIIGIGRLVVYAVVCGKLLPGKGRTLPRGAPRYRLYLNIPASRDVDCSVTCRSRDIHELILSLAVVLRVFSSPAQIVETHKAGFKSFHENLRVWYDTETLDGLIAHSGTPEAKREIIFHSRTSAFSMEVNQLNHSHDWDPKDL